MSFRPLEDLTGRRQCRMHELPDIAYVPRGPPGRGPVLRCGRPGLAGDRSGGGCRRLGREPVRAAVADVPLGAGCPDDDGGGDLRPVRGGADPRAAARRPVLRPVRPPSGAGARAGHLRARQRVAHAGRVRDRMAVRRPAGRRCRQRSGVQLGHRVDQGTHRQRFRPGRAHRRPPRDDRHDHGIRGGPAGRGSPGAGGTGSGRQLLRAARGTHPGGRAVRAAHAGDPRGQRGRPALVSPAVA